MRSSLRAKRGIRPKAHRAVGPLSRCGRGVGRCPVLRPTTRRAQGRRRRAAGRRSPCRSRATAGRRAARSAAAVPRAARCRSDARPNDRLAIATAASLMTMRSTVSPIGDPDPATASAPLEPRPGDPDRRHARTIEGDDLRTADGSRHAAVGIAVSWRRDLWSRSAQGNGAATKCPAHRAGYSRLRCRNEMDDRCDDGP